MATAAIRTKTGRRYRLSAEERELLISISEVDTTAHVHCDSPRLGRKVKKFCNRMGITMEPVGAGFEAYVPFEALVFKIPRKKHAVKEKQRRRS
jgi:hypothetical protein